MLNAGIIALSIVQNEITESLVNLELFNDVVESLCYILT